HPGERRGDFEAEKAAADNDDARGVLGGLPERLGIPYCLQVMDACKCGARNGQANGLRPCRNQQFVEVEVPGAIGAHKPVRRIDGDRKNARHYVDRLLPVVSRVVDHKLLFWQRAQEKLLGQKSAPVGPTRLARDQQDAASGASSARSVSAALTPAGPPPSSTKSKCFGIYSPFASISILARFEGTIMFCGSWVFIPASDLTASMP